MGWPMIDNRVITFLTVCRELNYTKAARRLHITQPNVSQHIRWLEDYYQQKLFIYRGRKLELTPAGEILKNAAVAMKHEEALLKKELSELEEPGKETVSFGITRSINEGTQKEKIVDFIKKFSHGRVHFYVDNTKNLLEKLEREQIDFCIVEGNFDRSRYDSITLSKESFIPVCAGRYPLPEREMKLEQLCREPLIIRESGSGSREILEDILHSRNYTYENFASVMEIGDISVIKELLAEGCGITFLYKTAVEKEIQSGKIREILLSDLHVRHDFSVVWLKTLHFREQFERLAEQFY